MVVEWKAFLRYLADRQLTSQAVRKRPWLVFGHVATPGVALVYCRTLTYIWFNSCIHARQGLFRTYGKIPSGHKVTPGVT